MRKKNQKLISLYNEGAEIGALLTVLIQTTKLDLIGDHVGEFVTEVIEIEKEKSYKQGVAQGKEIMSFVKEKD